MTRAVRWLGHASVVLETRSGARLLTDPLLRGRLFHITRRVAPVDAAVDLGRIDAILLSHVHRDHLDRPTLRAIARTGHRIPVVAPRGAGPSLRGLGLGTVHELAPGETTTVAGVHIHATPAAHRALRRGRPVPALGYVADRDLYFAGDTDLFAAMEHLGPLALALLPVWGYGPTLGPGHLDPDRAARAAALLRPAVAVPIHWGTYFPLPLGLRAGGHRLLRDPPHAFAAAAARVAPATRVEILAPGGRLTL